MQYQVEFDLTSILFIYQSRGFKCGGVWEGFKVKNVDNYFLYKGKLIILETYLNVPHG
jgi:hypothetical protein